MTDKNKKRAAISALSVFTAVCVAIGGMFESPVDLVKPGEAIFPPGVVRVVKTQNIVDPDDTLDDEDESEEEEEKTLKQKLRDLVLRLPVSVRVLVILPMWASGFALSALASALWTAVLSPLLAHILRWLISSLLMLLLLALTLKLLFPDIPWRKLLSKRNIICVLVFNALLEILDVVMPRIWDKYETYMTLIRVTSTILITTALILAASRRLKLLRERIQDAKRNITNVIQHNPQI